MAEDVQRGKSTPEAEVDASNLSSREVNGRNAARRIAGKIMRANADREAARRRRFDLI